MSGRSVDDILRIVNERKDGICISKKDMPELIMRFCQRAAIQMAKVRRPLNQMARLIYNECPNVPAKEECGDTVANERKKKRMATSKHLMRETRGHAGESKKKIIAKQPTPHI